MDVKKAEISGSATATSRPRLIVENKEGMYFLHIKVGAGAEISESVRGLLLDIANTQKEALSEQEVSLLQEIFSQDIVKLTVHERVEVKNALIRANIGIEFEGEQNPVEFDGTFGMPKTFRNFTGREVELAQLRENLGKPQLIVQKISGTGGLGKSQLANYFARQMLQEGRYKWVIWLSGGLDENAAESALYAQLIMLGQELGINVKQIKEKALYRAIYQRLFEKGRGLIVFDDMPNYDVMVPYLPENLNHAQSDLLITTRNDNYFGLEVAVIPLDVFTLEDARQYICNMLKERVTEAEAEQLATTLGRYPLALTQAIAYIANNRECSVSLYCERYHKTVEARKVYLARKVTYDPYEQERREKERPYEATMIAVVEMSLKQIAALCESQEKYERVIAILMAAAYLAPEVTIPKSLLTGWLPEDKDELQLTEALEYLRAFSLLQEAKREVGYQIHQVVQDILKINETTEKIQERLLSWNNIIKGYLDLKRPTEVIKERVYIAIKPHLGVLADQLSQQPREKRFLEAEAAMEERQGKASRFQGCDNESVKRFARALSCYQQREPIEDDLSVGLILMNLGWALFTCGAPEQAEVNLQRALPIIKHHRGARHSDVGGCLMNLGNVVLSLGDTIRAIEYLNEAEDILKEVNGSEHVEYVTCLVNLAEALLSRGDSTRSLSCFERALPILKLSLGEAHVDVGKCLLGVSGALLALNNPELAMEKVIIASQILKEALGDRHVYVGKCLMTSGAIKTVLNDKSAMKDLQNALEILKSSLGEKNVEVGKCLMNIGFLRCKDGVFDQGCSDLMDALSILILVLKSPHLEIGKCKKFIAMAELSQQHFRNAERYLEEAMDIFTKISGDKNVEVGRCLIALGLLKLIDDESDVEFFDKGMAILINCLGEGDDEVKSYRMERWKTRDPAQAIRRAVVSGTTADLSALLKYYPEHANEPDKAPDKKKTALHLAVINRRVDQVVCLLPFVGFTTFEDAQELSALDYAIQGNHTDILNYFLQELLKYYTEYQVDLTQLPKLVRICAQLGDESGLKLLIHLKVGIDEAGPKSGQTALHLAVMKGHARCVMLLMAAGANPHQRDFQNQTPISLSEDKPNLKSIFFQEENVEYPSSVQKMN